MWLGPRLALLRPLFTWTAQLTRGSGNSSYELQINHEWPQIWLYLCHCLTSDLSMTLSLSSGGFLSFANSGQMEGYVSGYGPALAFSWCSHFGESSGEGQEPVRRMGLWLCLMAS